MATTSSALSSGAFEALGAGASAGAAATATSPPGAVTTAGQFTPGVTNQAPASNPSASSAAGLSTTSILPAGASASTSTSLLSSSSTPPSTSQSSAQASQPAATPLTGLASTTVALPSGSTSLASSPSAASSSQPASKHSSNTGAIAGAAVGAAIGAAILTGLIVWLLTRSRMSKQRSRSYRDRDWEEKGSRQVASPTPLPTPAKQLEPYQWQRNMPQSADDATVKQWVKTMTDQVEMHVENFYRDSPTGAVSGSADALASLDIGSLPQNMVKLVSKSRNATNIIKHCMMQHIIASIDPCAPSYHCLLPSDAVGVPRAWLNGRSQNPKQRDFRDKAFSQWKSLTAVLRAPLEADLAFTHERDQTITKLVSTFGAAFKPWETGQNSEGERSSNLAGVLQNASETGMSLLSQPSRFSFLWRLHPSEQRGNSIITVPGFLKESDETGGELAQPQVLIRPTSDQN